MVCVALCVQVFILVCLVAWFSKTETCHRLMTNLFHSDITGLSDTPSPLQPPLPPSATPPLHSELILYCPFLFICYQCVISWWYVTCVSDDEVLKTLNPTLTAVKDDSVTPPHLQQQLQRLNNRDLPNGDINGDMDEKTKSAPDERDEPSDSDHRTDVASSLNNSEVRVLRQRGDGFALKCDGGEACWRPMVTTHWPRLLKLFGFTVASRFVIKLACVTCTWSDFLCCLTLPFHLSPSLSLSLSLRFLTLLPPIKLKFQVGFTSAPPTSPPPSFIAIILANPNTIRVVFIIAMAAIVISYSTLLVHHSRHRHEKYVQSWKMRNPYNKVACLKGHTQVSWS